MSANINPIKKILILRFSSIGDIVLTSPVIRCLKQQRDLEIHYLVKNSFKSILSGNPHIDSLFSFEKEPTELIKVLKEQSYDHIVDLHKNIRTKRLLRSLGRPYSNFPKKNIEKWLLVNFKIDRLPNLHIVDRYFEAVKGLGVENDHKGLEYFIPKKDHVDLSSYDLKEYEYIAIGIGAAHATKSLPFSKLQELLNLIDQQVVLLGGEKEVSLANKLEHANCVNLCGQLNINQSASIIAQSALLISADTGLMHIASAFKKKTVSIWGNTVPAFGMYPYYGDDKVENFRAEVNGLSCRPCSKIGYKKCPRGHFDCMMKHDLKEIAAHTERLFNRKKA